ncbi:MAG TPA: DUF177 domain-containing protein [Ramlibacter sp.]|jgi:uncharacterized protein|uniref:YceD family protein n=1 Tax=Ramlibacter sp. TaxID=1917967 RepID=UPI002D494D0C|nr:DUF177 domain-containing protein [Ramlibacter sp.]HZY20308.1 DUF177 domain-containing protein [Ramlibacter sp.]
MNRQFSPTRLDVRAFAEDAAQLSGTARVGDFKRLAAEAAGQGNDRPVQWSAQGEMLNPRHVQPQVWVHLRADAVLPMTCQRCLEPVDVALQVDRPFRFVADEETAAAEDDEAEEDLLAISRAFDLLQLIEDELLMEVPVVPRHEVCPAPVQLSAADPDFEEASAPENPFARLKDLRNGRG